MSYRMSNEHIEMVTDDVKRVARHALRHIEMNLAFEVYSDGCKIIEFDGNDKISMMNYVGFFVGTTVSNAITELESYLED